MWVVSVIMVSAYVLLKRSYLLQIYTEYLWMKLYVWDLLQNSKGWGETVGVDVKQDWL